MAESHELNHHHVKILFFGQCLNYGYQGVTRGETFPSLAAASLRERFPRHTFKFDMKYFYHPRGLKALLRHRLMVSSPDIVVIAVPAMFAARHWRVSALYELAPEIVDTARSFLQKIESRLRREPSDGRTTLDRTFTVHPPLAIADYERLIGEGLAYCRSKSSSRPVLLGPGRFNEDTIENYPIHSPDLWSSVNEMVARLGRRFQVPVINAQNMLEDYDGDVFIPNNHRWSRYGHELVAREVESVLIPEVTALSGRFSMGWIGQQDPVSHE
jgi:hypothetical protein